MCWVRMCLGMELGLESCWRRSRILDLKEWLKSFRSACCDESYSRSVDYLQGGLCFGRLVLIDDGMRPVAVGIGDLRHAISSVLMKCNLLINSDSKIGLIYN